MRQITVLLGAILAIVFATTASAQPLRVLVVNDDGITATGTDGGIDVLVDHLRNNPELLVRVVAPDVNKSASGDSITFPPTTIGATPGTTVGSLTDPNDVAVDGFPADCVTYAITGLGFQPDLVVAGINGGQNLGREVGTSISGTVGAALTAGRNGIPAIAVSMERDVSDYTAAALYVSNMVEAFRKKKGFRKKLASKNGLGMSAVLSINVPGCTSGGSLRGVEVVPLAQLRTITGYVEGPPETFTATADDNFVPAIFGVPDCTSTLEDPTNDLDAFMNGFISVTVLNPDETVDNKLRRFRFVRNIDFE